MVGWGDEQHMDGSRSALKDKGKHRQGGRAQGRAPANRGGRQGGGGGRGRGRGKKAPRAGGGGGGAYPTMKKLGSAMKTGGNAVGRWLGVTSQEEFALQQQQWAQRKQRKAYGDQHRRKSWIEPKLTGFQKHWTTKQMNRRNKYSSSEESDDDEDEVRENERTFTRDPTEGIAIYRRVREEERLKEVKPGWFGGEVNKHRKSVANLDDFRTAQRAPKRKHSKLRDQTMVQLQLQAMQEYYPWFTNCVTALQCLIMLGILVHAYTSEEIAEIAMPGSATEGTCESANCPLDFLGNTQDNATVPSDANWAVGPNVPYMLKLGALYSPCMRLSQEMQINAARQRAAQCIEPGQPRDDEIGYKCEVGEAPYTETPASKRGYACCKTLRVGFHGMTSYDQCESFFNQDMAIAKYKKETDLVNEKFPKSNESAAVYWEAGVDCTSLVSDAQITLRPCCGVRMSASENRCELMTQTQCVGQQGVWQQDKLLCSDTMCLNDLCSLQENIMSEKAEIDINPANRNEPIDPNQWWRFILPLFIHSGVLHCLLAMMVQYYVCRGIEKQAGFLRTFLIYFISGVGGYTISGNFAPGSVSMGSDPGVYGMLGVMFVELFQAWQVVPKPGIQLLKLSLIIAVSLLVGTLPYIDNWSHVGGFVFGVVSGVIFLPYITFGKWDARRKKIFIYVCTFLIFFMFLMSFLTFYHIGNSEFCSWCKYLNCIPYTDDLDCNQQY